jgi:polyhydroxyalkanoate synthesis regulator phasin
MANLKSVFYTSIGLALKGKKKVEQAAKRFVRDNKLEAAEGKKFINDAVKHAEIVKNELSKKINESVKATVSTMILITHKEISNLKKEIQQLSKNLHKANNPSKTKNTKSIKKSRSKK